MKGIVSRAALRRLEATVRASKRAATPAPSPAPRTRTSALYTAAGSGPLTGDWLTSLLDPNDETKLSADRLRGRARDLRRNNPLVARYADACVDHLIGPNGITLQAAPSNSRGEVNRALAQQCERAWYGWGRRAALDGATWDAVCRSAAETWRVEGETLGEIVYDSRLPLGLGVHLLDVDLIITDLNQPAGAGRPEIVQGIERDAFGGVAAVHVWTYHPAKVAGGANRRRVIPAARLLYLAHRPRLGMLRAVTPLAPVMLRLQMLNGTQESLVVLHRIAAAKMGFFSRKSGADALEADEDDATRVTMEATPGLAEQLPDDTTFTPWDPGQPTQQYDPFQKSLKAEIAAGVGMSYATLTGDMSEASFSSARLGVEAERDRWQTLQQQFVDAFVAPMYAAVIAQAQIRGEVVAPPGSTLAQVTAATWHPRRWGYVDPAKDVTAAQQRIASGLTTITRELNALGLDRDEVFRERAAELALAQELGIPLQESAPPAAPAPDAAVTPPPLRKLA